MHSIEDRFYIRNIHTLNRFMFITTFPVEFSRCSRAIEIHQKRRIGTEQLSAKD